MSPYSRCQCADTCAGWPTRQLTAYLLFGNARGLQTWISPLYLCIKALKKKKKEEEEEEDDDEEEEEEEKEHLKEKQKKFDCFFVCVWQVNKSQRFTQYRVRRKRVQPFPHTCVYIQIQSYPPFWSLHTGLGNRVFLFCLFFELLNSFKEFYWLADLLIMLGSLGCPDRDSTFEFRRQHPSGWTGALVLIWHSTLANSAETFS